MSGTDQNRAPGQPPERPPERPPDRRPERPRVQPPRARFFARLRPWEVATVLEWLAAELRRGVIEAEVDGAPVRFPLEAPVRLRVTAERQPVGGRLRVRLYWESTEHGAITIESA